MVLQGKGPWDERKSVAGQLKKDKPMEPPVAGEAVDGKAADEKTDRNTSATISGCQIKIDEGNFKGTGHACLFGGGLYAPGMVLQDKEPSKSGAGQPKKDKPRKPSVAEKAANGKAKKGADATAVTGEEANGKPKKFADEKTGKMTPAGISDCKIEIGKGDFDGIGHGCLFAGGLHAAPPS